MNHNMYTEFLKMIFLNKMCFYNCFSSIGAKNIYKKINELVF